MNKLKILIGILVLSCGQKDQAVLDEVVGKLLSERKKVFLDEQLLQCNRNLYSLAQTTADSMLRIESKALKLDSIKVPHDTLKPIKPEVRFPQYKTPERQEKSRG